VRLAPTECESLGPASVWLRHPAVSVTLPVIPGRAVYCSGASSHFPETHPALGGERGKNALKLLGKQLTARCVDTYYVCAASSDSAQPKTSIVQGPLVPACSSERGPRAKLYSLGGWRENRKKNQVKDQGEGDQGGVRVGRIRVKNQGEGSRVGRMQGERPQH
jgi:hypothetical protein